MSQVAIHKCQSPETIPQRFLERLEAITDSIRKRAFSIFQHRGGGSGSEVDDWLQAELDVVLSPASELVEGAEEFRARIALPGFDVKDIQVSAMPDALVIQANATHTHVGERGDVCFCEFSGKTLFRRLELPTPIEVEKVSASLDKGILEVTAPKTTRRPMTSHAVEQTVVGNRTKGRSQKSVAMGGRRER
jgi:HSP20 family protein